MTTTTGYRMLGRQRVRQSFLIPTGTAIRMQRPHVKISLQWPDIDDTGRSARHRVSSSVVAFSGLDQSTGLDSDQQLP
jgi:hypothetical protein